MSSAEKSIDIVNNKNGKQKSALSNDTFSKITAIVKKNCDNAYCNNLLIESAKITKEALDTRDNILLRHCVEEVRYNLKKLLNYVKKYVVNRLKYDKNSVVLYLEFTFLHFRMVLIKIVGHHFSE